MSALASSADFQSAVSADFQSAGWANIPARLEVRNLCGLETRDTAGWKPALHASRFMVRGGNASQTARFTRCGQTRRSCSKVYFRFVSPLSPLRGEAVRRATHL